MSLIVSGECAVKKPVSIAVQVLLVVAIGVLLWSVLYRSRHIHASAITSTCLLNLRQIEGAKAMLAKEQGLKRGATVNADTVAKYMEFRWPKCPAGGKYTVNPIGTAPTCSTPGHSLAP